MNIRHIKTIRNLVLGLVLSLVLAACGGSDDNTSPDDTKSSIEPEATWGASTWGVDCWGQPCS